MILQSLESHELRRSNRYMRSDPGLQSSPFGKIVQTNGNPRLIQFSLHWAF